MDENAIFILCVYFLPALIAALRRHHNQNAIFLTNLFFGWTVIGWVVALIVGVVVVCELMGLRYISNNRVGVIEKLWSSRGSVSDGRIIIDA